MGKINESLYSSNRQDWETPPPWVDRLIKFRGSIFDLDPSCKKPNIPATHHFIYPAFDGLALPWNVVPKATAFMNPEYCNLGDWVRKAIHEVNENGCRVWGLFPSRLDTMYWHDWVFQEKGFVVFLRNRMSFWLDGKPYRPICPKTGKEKDSTAPFPAALVYWGRDYKAVKQRFIEEPPFEGVLIKPEAKIVFPKIKKGKISVVRG